ncbi:hypothetical protein O2W18_17460 [Modestobacter sp. VKM Ac-2983]|uniref:hypothetical protein n=1 Tax=Modestobacter sp. VKM Ac-2983 TaxID=3004137 RepID=UPI0022AB591B|nr:hypothetical protein [Modestobacter sp. VKM Ac-2983]MCZ2806898.1 hypothetical protein [Modestobacter sp. VKM Ac-2983]
MTTEEAGRAESAGELALVELVRAADTAWSTAAGVTRHWRRQDLVIRAFHRHYERRSAQDPDAVTWLVSTSDEGSGDAGDDSGGPADDVLETVLEVAADRPLRRRRAELVSGRGEEHRADLLVVDQDTFWARTGTEISTNHGNVDHGHGGADIIDALLCPGYVPALFSLTPRGRTQLAGRDCIEVGARPRTDVPDDERWKWTGSPLDMITGGDEFRLAVDVGTGIIVRASKFVDGDLAEVTEWLELRLDPVLPTSLFAPL